MPNDQVPTDEGAPIAIELGPIATRVIRSLNGEVPMECIETLLRRLLDEEFSEARVTALLPILLHRSVVESVRREAR